MIKIRRPSSFERVESFVSRQSVLALDKDHLMALDHRASLLILVVPAPSLPCTRTHSLTHKPPA